MFMGWHGIAWHSIAQARDGTTRPAQGPGPRFQGTGQAGPGPYRAMTHRARTTMVCNAITDTIFQYVAIALEGREGRRRRRHRFTTIRTCSSPGMKIGISC